MEAGFFMAGPLPAGWLTDAQATPQRKPRLEISPVLTFCFERVCSMASHTLSQTTQTQVRMSHALTLLQQGLNPLEVALACGYDSPSRFAARFKQEFGLTPLPISAHQPRNRPATPSK
jgi:AraC-like DNA-binding protein